MPLDDLGSGFDITARYGNPILAYNVKDVITPIRRGGSATTTSEAAVIRYGHLICANLDSFGHTWRMDLRSLLSNI